MRLRLEPVRWRGEAADVPLIVDANGSWSPEPALWG
jgi:hypothetical protein